VHLARDHDDLELSNLHRQILHHTHAVGQPKVHSAQKTIASYNPDVRVIPYRVRLTSANAMEIISQYDMVVGAVDSYGTRYLLNDACYLAGKPLIDGAVFLLRASHGVYPASPATAVLSGATTGAVVPRPARSASGL
jgi:adenylyltransferase/sulfurtransferase